MQRFRIVLTHVPWEGVVWVAGLAALALIDSAACHLTICPLRLVGIDFCPGCGLGRSVSLLLHGQFAASWEAHPLGAPAIVLLLGRSARLLLRRRPRFSTRPLSM